MMLGKSKRRYSWQSFIICSFSRKGDQQPSTIKRSEPEITVPFRLRLTTASVAMRPCFVHHRPRHWLYHWHPRAVLSLEQGLMIFLLLCLWHWLYIPLARLSTIGDRAFPVAAARTWNSLPPEVTSSQCLRSFKTKLKTIRYGTIDDLHWKTDRQAASFI